MTLISLENYLYNGDTVLKILHNYAGDLRQNAIANGNPIDLLHCEFLEQIRDILEHNDFLTSQSQRIREFYKYMAKEYPYLAFTFKGRIKSLLRAEKKYNRNIVEYIENYYEKNGNYPSILELKNRLNCFRDLIAYRIVISLPKCHVTNDVDRESQELKLLYDIANRLPGFLSQFGFRPEFSVLMEDNHASMLDKCAIPYYRNYITHPGKNNYRSLHITLYDEIAHCYVELQLRTKEMDDHAEIGTANHLEYENSQEFTQTVTIPAGECIYYDDAYRRLVSLQQLDLSKVDVNMFTAINNILMNDGCGFYRGRQILPYEHLSRFQNDLID